MIKHHTDSIMMRPHVIKYLKIWVFLLLLAAASVCVHIFSDAAAAAAAAPTPPPGDDTIPTSLFSRVFKKNKGKWSSMLSVDPKRILSILVDRGGLLIPAAAESDIRLLRQFVRVETAELNVVEKHLILHNFTIGIEGQPHALCIGRVYIHWSSYSAPCLDIEVDDVDVLVEFTNLLLTRNNWDELKEAGFPPQSWMVDTDSPFLSFLRFASIDLAGLASVRITSRPLDKEIGAFSLDMIATKGLSESILQRARENEQANNQNGVSSAELAAILQTYFNRKIRNFLADRLQDVATNPEAVIRDADEFLTKTKGTILNYANHAGKKTKADIEQAIVNKLGDLGLESPDKRYNILKESARKLLQNTDVRGLLENLANIRLRDRPSNEKEDKSNKDGDSDEDTNFDIEMNVEPAPPDL